MIVWLPYLSTGGGNDTYFERLAKSLYTKGHQPILQRIPLKWQYFPFWLSNIAAPVDAKICIAGLNIAFALKRDGMKVIAIEHHCVLDPAYKPFRSLYQTIYHESLVKYFSKSSLRCADAVVAVSDYTAGSLYRALGGPRAHVIKNGIETDFFTPAPQVSVQNSKRPFRLLYVGNLIYRKGSDLLPRIMMKLGNKYELYYTSGLRTRNTDFDIPNMKPLGRLSREQLRDEYRKADLLLFPTRFEGFGYAAAEAMACGTPVVTSNCSSLPEVVQDGISGRLVGLNDIDGFADAIRDLAANNELLKSMGNNARRIAKECFSIDRMGTEYDLLLNELTG